MTRQPDHRDQRVAAYLRRRGEVRLPATFIDDVTQAAAASPQSSNRPPWWRTPVLAVATVMVAAVVTLTGLALIGEAVGESPAPSPFLPSSASPSASMTTAPSAEPEPSASSAPTGAPTSSPLAVRPGDVLVSVTDDLVVRSQPDTGSDSEIYDVLLQPGDLLRLTDGPVTADGYTWYQGVVLDSSAPDGTRAGWVAAADQDGSQWLASPPPEGDGWRLLGESAAGVAPFTVDVATTADDLASLWADAGLDAPFPDVDFEREVVVRYTHAVSGSCPDIELAGVDFDATERILYSVPIDPSSPLFDGRTCTTDANPHSFVVAVDRDRLPSGDVLVRLQRGFIACPDCGRESEQVTVTLP